jgi:hypothetical protein
VKLKQSFPQAAGFLWSIWRRWLLQPSSLLLERGMNYCLRYFFFRTGRSTIPVALLQFTGTYGTNWSAVLASISVTIIPSIIFYVFLQSKIIEGTTAVAVKS